MYKEQEEAKAKEEEIKMPWYYARAKIIIMKMYKINILDYYYKINS